jgi:hypothetical protein
MYVPGGMMSAVASSTVTVPPAFTNTGAVPWLKIATTAYATVFAGTTSIV